MDNIKLEQANALQKNINIAKENLQAWENSNGFVNNGGPHIQWRKENGDYRNGTVPVTPETFGVVKAINVMHWQGIVAQLEKEYEQL